MPARPKSPEHHPWPVRASRFGNRKNKQIFGIGFELQRRTERHINNVALVVISAAAAEQLFTLFEHADHAKFLTADLQMSRRSDHRTGNIRRLRLLRSDIRSPFRRFRSAKTNGRLKAPHWLFFQSPAVFPEAAPTTMFYRSCR